MQRMCAGFDRRELGAKILAELPISFLEPCMVPALSRALDALAQVRALGGRRRGGRLRGLRGGASGHGR